MLAAVHHPDTPGSASKHSALGHSCYSDRGSHKRRNLQESSQVFKRQGTSASSFYESHHLDPEQITFTKIPKFSETQSRERRIPEKNISLVPKSQVSETGVSDASKAKNPILLNFFSSTSDVGYISEEVTLIPTSSKSCSDKKKGEESFSSSTGVENSEIDISDDLLTVEKVLDFETASGSSEEKNESVSPLKIEESAEPNKTTPTILNRSRVSKTQLKIERAKLLLKEKEIEDVKFKKPFVANYNDSPTSHSTGRQKSKCSSLEDESSPSLQKYNWSGVNVSTGDANDSDKFDCDTQAELYSSPEKPKEALYYQMGFPNPPGENRCWLNATLHAIFALPVLSKLADFHFLECSELTQGLVTVQKHWRNSEKQQVFQSIEKFKEELKVLDESYPSECQQDVSEFLTIFFNYIRADFEKLLASNDDNSEIENVPTNQNDSLRRLPGTSMSDSTKRSPLADISASAGQQGNQVVACSSLSSNNKVKNDAQSENSNNPIDEFFSQYMVENYICEGCNIERQQKIANLMLFVDLPQHDFGTVNLTDVIDKTFAMESRNLTCETCKHPNHAMSTKFVKFPKILTVQVKRYEMNGDGEISKKCTSVNIPTLLKLDPSNASCDQDTSRTAEYEPICIISHVGGSMNCGHYTSYVKHDLQWYYFNDLDVREMSTKEALKAAQRTAYLIFFKDVTLDDIC